MCLRPLSLSTLLVLVSLALSAHAAAQAAEPAVPSEAAEVPASAAPVQGAESASRSHADPRTSTSASAKLSVPLPTQLAWRDLHELQGRESELWAERYRHSMGVPATGIALGTPLAFMLIPWGSILVTDSHYTDAYGGDDVDTRLRRAGALMLTSGLLVLGAVAVSVWQVSRVRRQRAAIDSELRALSASRTSIERMLELYAAPTPGS